MAGLCSPTQNFILSQIGCALGYIRMLRLVLWEHSQFSPKPNLVGAYQAHGLVCQNHLSGDVGLNVQPKQVAFIFYSLQLCIVQYIINVPLKYCLSYFLWLKINHITSCNGLFLCLLCMPTTRMLHASPAIWLCSFLYMYHSHLFQGCTSCSKSFLIPG